MLIRIWGCRGSLPVAMNTATLRGKLAKALLAAQGKRFGGEEDAQRFIENELDFAVANTFGGNTSCVEIEGGEDYIVCDLGSGVREFGNRVLASRSGKPATFHFFLSHLHWDHIMGFPFFVPAYLPGNRVNIYGCHPDMEAAFLRQQHPVHFPVELSQMAAEIRFIPLTPGETVDVAGLRVTPMKQHHAGDSYGYRFEQEGRAFVYSTDSEHSLENVADTEAFVEFFRDADLVLFDAMYSLADAVSLKKDWGHSSNVVGVELCQMAGVRHLCLFHHEPVYDDARLAAIWNDSRRLEEITRGERPLRISSACDGLEIPL